MSFETYRKSGLSPKKYFRSIFKSLKAGILTIDELDAWEKFMLKKFYPFMVE